MKLYRCRRFIDLTNAEIAAVICGDALGEAGRVPGVAEKFKADCIDKLKCDCWVIRELDVKRWYHYEFPLQQSSNERL